MSLKKYKKSDLIKLINNYEDDITDLQDRLERQHLDSLIDAPIKYVIIDKERDNPQLIYLKQRIRCVRMNQIYINELERLMSSQINN